MNSTSGKENSIKIILGLMDFYGITIEQIKSAQGKEVTYRIGNRFYINGGDEEYLLAQIDPDVVCLVSTVDGNRWNNSQRVVDSLKVTVDEMKLLINYAEYELVD